MNNIEVEGVEKLCATFDKMANGDRLSTLMGKCCAMVENSAKRAAPKDTGALRRSIASKVEKSDGEIIGTVYTPLEYAPFVEYGTGLFAPSGRKKVPWNYQDDEGEWHSTSGMKPQPFMNPALNQNRKAILTLLGEALKK